MALGFWVVYGVNIQNIIAYDGINTEVNLPTPTFNIIYSGLSRAAWGLCMAWMVFACEKGYGGEENS